MKPILFLSLSVLLLGGIFSCTQNTPAVSDPTIQEYYPIQADTRLWIYTKTTYAQSGATLTHVSDTLNVIPISYQGHQAFKFLSARDASPIAIQYYSGNEVMNVDLTSSDTAAQIFFVYPLKVGEKFIISSDTNASGDVHQIQLIHLNDPSSVYLPPGYDRAFDEYDQISLKGKVGAVLDTEYINAKEFYPDEGLDGSIVTTYSSNGNFRSSILSFKLLQ